jgi:DNA-binding NtrC family response regulator
MATRAYARSVRLPSTHAFPVVVVRELRAFDVMQRSSVTGSETAPSLREITHRATAEAERQAIRLALQATGGNKSEAARLLRVDYKTLHLKMKRYGIEAREFRAS